jgi:hypothetical protein
VTLVTTDIFEFWSKIAPDQRVHPRDQPVFDRVSHGFDLRCLPACFFGPLETAPVVLLYLSPGFAEEEIAAADSKEMQFHLAASRTGTQPLSGPSEYPSRWRWWSSRTKLFGDWDSLRSSIAVLNIGAYHSKDFVDAPLLAALPSSRVTLDWAQEALFTEAMEGRRIVVCMRAARFWGLDKASRHGQSLYAPKVTRGGHMTSGVERDEIMAVVTAAVAAHRKD